MAERPDQIEKHIESTRSELGSNFQELEAKVKQAVDWKTYFERNPMMLLGLALGGGVMLGSMTGSARRRDIPAAPASSQIRSSLGGIQTSQMNDSWETLKGALLGLAGMKVRNLLNDALPGFNEQYQKMEREKSAYTSSPRPTAGREFDSSAHRM